VVSFTSLSLYHPGKSFRYPLNRGLGEEKYLALPGIEPGASTPCLVDIPTLDIIYRGILKQQMAVRIHGCA
jgi:hypothetical protein